MLLAVKNQSLTKHNILLLSLLFLFFMGLYTFLDFEGSTNYTIMTQQFGLSITIIHIGINIIIAVLSSIMVTFSIINYKLTKIEPLGSNVIPMFTFLFGILTFGCTSCVVAFLAAVGIAFSPIVFPNANLIWKLVALLFVILGFVWIMYSIEHTKCKLKK